MVLPHSPEEKELTEGDHESPESSRQLIETTPITTDQPSCTTGISSIEFLLLTNLMGDCTAPLLAQ